MNLREFIFICQVIHDADPDFAGYAPVGDDHSARDLTERLSAMLYVRRADAALVCRALARDVVADGPWCRLTRRGLEELAGHHVPGFDHDKLLGQIISAETAGI